MTAVKFCRIKLTYKGVWLSKRCSYENMFIDYLVNVVNWK